MFDPETLTYVRITIYLVLFSFSILSLRTMFRHIRLFGVGLMFVCGSLMVAAGMRYFFGDSAAPFNSLLLTVAIIGWMIAWLLELGYYDKDK